jgi:hypothetical protein
MAQSAVVETDAMMSFKIEILKSYFMLKWVIDAKQLST